MLQASRVSGSEPLSLPNLRSLTRSSASANSRQIVRSSVPIVLDVAEKCIDPS